MSLFKGAGVALITPFNKDKSVNYDELGRITVIRKDGSTEDIIVNGRFVVPGTEKLNEPLDELDAQA